MKTAEQAIIHLGDRRGHLENEWMRSMITFNFGNYKAENRNPFGTLQVFNEDTLAAGKSIAMVVEQHTEVIIIPLSGTLFFKDQSGKEMYVNPGQIQLFSTGQQNSYQISNPFEDDELICFLQIWLYKNETIFTSGLQQFNFDLTADNQMHSIITPRNLHQRSYCSMGKYEGRKKDRYTLQDKKSGVYFFVVAGAFEVQDRLLQAKDGLAIWSTAEVDFEALSNEAILLLLEIPVN